LNDNVRDADEDRLMRVCQAGPTLLSAITRLSARPRQTAPAHPTDSMVPIAHD